MTALDLSPTWFNDALDSIGMDDVEESATYAELTIRVLGENIGQIETSDTGVIAKGPRLPLYGLAHGLAENWWRLLHEPEKENRDTLFEARHRLDAFTTGYVFPPVALWSGGAEGLVIRVLTLDQRFHSQRFVRSEIEGPRFLPRYDAEAALHAFVENVVSRFGSNPPSALADAWNRVQASLSDKREADWCIAAARLGFDPYDSETPDLDELAGSLDPELFAELSEAATIDQLPKERDWLETVRNEIGDTRPIEVGGFSPFPPDLTRRYAPHAGYQAARALRNSLSMDSRDFADRVIGRDWDGRHCERRTITQGVARRIDNRVESVVAATDLPQYRFRRCQALFLGCYSATGRERLVSSAKVWLQQAARAFAAELLAPADYLRERAGATGLSLDLIRQLSEELCCRDQVIRDQAHNNGIPLVA